MKKEERRSIQEILHDLGAIMQGGHFAFRSGHHGSTYVNKNAIFPHIRETSDLCAEIADHFANNNVEVVAGPAMGGIIMSQWVAYHLFALTGKDVLSLYAEKETVRIPDPEGEGRLCFYETGRFVFGRGYENLLIGKNVLVVEDVVTTGSSVKEVVQSVYEIGGTVVGVGVLCNRGKVTRTALGNVPKFIALSAIDAPSVTAEQCRAWGLCAQGVPINQDVGKGHLLLP